MTREPAGPTAVRKEAARAMRVLEEDVFETLEHARVFRGRVDPTWPPEEWPPDVTTGDDIRRMLRRIDTRLGVIQRGMVVIFERVTGDAFPPGWLIHDDEAAILDDADDEADDGG
jgi:hypothetical protein